MGRAEKLGVEIGGELAMQASRCGESFPHFLLSAL